MSYRSPEQMVDKLVELVIRFGWGYTVEQIVRLRSTVHPSYLSSRTAILVPDLWLRNLPETIKGLWAMVAEIHPVVSHEDFFDGLELLGGLTPDDEYSVGWTVIKPMEMERENPARVCTIMNSPGLQMLLLCIFQPEWPRFNLKYNGQSGTSPRYWLPGLVAKVSGQTETLVPYLCGTSHGSLHFGVDTPRAMGPNTYVPTMRRKS